MIARLRSRFSSGVEQHALADSWANRAYFLCVVALAAFALLCMAWPKSSQHPMVQANIEVILDDELLDSQQLRDLLVATSDEILSDEQVPEIVDLVLAGLLPEEKSFGVDARDCIAWLKQLDIRAIDSDLADYRLIEISGMSLPPSLASRLVNQTSIALSERLNQKLLQQRVQEAWQYHQAELEDSLRYRRQWVSDLESAVARQQEKLQALKELNDQSATDSVPASFASSSDPHIDLADRQSELELLFADIEMRQDQLFSLAQAQNWSPSHPEYRVRLAQIEDLERKAAALSNSTRIPRISGGLAGIRVEENEYYRKQNQTEAASEQVTAAITDLNQQSLEVSELQAEARQWLGREEQLNAQLSTWIDDVADTQRLVDLRLIELAQDPGVEAKAIPAGQWFAICLLALIVGCSIGLPLVRRPTMFRSAVDVGHQLGLPVLGAVEADRQRFRFWQFAKRHQSKIQMAAEVVILVTVCMVILAVVQESSLIGLLLRNPFDGLARSLQIFRGM